jgi:hypothetical protein
MARRLGREGPPVAVVVNEQAPRLRARDPPIFRGEPHEDVVEWLRQFQRVSDFNLWDGNQQLRQLPLCLEGVAERWFSSLNPRPDTFPALSDRVLRAFRHQNYEMELDSQLRARRQGPGEPVMTYCYDVVHLCSKINADMPEQEKVQHILRGLSPSLMEKVMPDLTQPFTVDQLFARIQVHCQAIAMANRALNNCFSAPVLLSNTLNPPYAGFVTKEELNASIASLRKEIKEDVSSTLTSFTAVIKDTIRSELKGSKTNEC